MDGFRQPRRLDHQHCGETFRQRELARGRVRWRHDARLIHLADAVARVDDGPAVHAQFLVSGKYERRDVDRPIVRQRHSCGCQPRARRRGRHDPALHARRSELSARLIARNSEALVERDRAGQSQRRDRSVRTSSSLVRTLQWQRV